MISSFSTQVQRRLLVLLHVARHHRVAAPAHRDVERRPRPAGIGQAGGEAGLLDEALGVERGLDLPHAFAAPVRIAVVFDFRGNLWRPARHGFNLRV